MDTLKRIILIFVIAGLSITANSQQQDFKALIAAFQNSYLKEASGDLPSAIEELKIVYNEESYEINLRLGWLCYSSGLFSESLSYYHRAVILKPFAIEPKFGLSYPAAAMGNWETVIKQYNDILEISPNNTIAMHKLALIHYGRKEYIEAEKLFSKVVNLFPFDYDGLLMLGWTNFQLKKYRESKVLFNKALMHTPSGISALEGMKLLD